MPPMVSWTCHVTCHHHDRPCNDDISCITAEVMATGMEIQRNCQEIEQTFPWKNSRQYVFFKYHVSQRIPRVVFFFLSLLLHCQIQTEIGLRNPVLRNSGGLSVRQLDVLESLFEVRHEIRVFINPQKHAEKGRFAMNCRISSLVTVSVSIFINVYHRKCYFCRMLYYHFSALFWGLLSAKNERPHYAWWNDEWSMWVEVGRGHLLFAGKINGFALHPLCKRVTWLRPEQGKDQNDNPLKTILLPCILYTIFDPYPVCSTVLWPAAENRYINGWVTP